MSQGNALNFTAQGKRVLAQRCGLAETCSTTLRSKMYSASPPITVPRKLKDYQTSLGFYDIAIAVAVDEGGPSGRWKLPL